MVKRVLYLRKAGARKVKNYPSVKTEMVLSDYAKRRILVLLRQRKLSSDHFEAAAKRRNKSELARDLYAFAKVQAKLHNW